MSTPEAIHLFSTNTVFASLSKAGSTSREALPPLTKAEQAGLLVGIGKPAMNLAMAIYNLDEIAEQRLVAHVIVWAAGEANAQGWPIVRGRPTVTTLSKLAVFEVIRPQNHERCGGTGCRGCGGSGKKLVSGLELARLSGLKKTDYFKNWQSRYQQILGYVLDLQGDVYRAINGGIINQANEINNNLTRGQM